MVPVTVVWYTIFMVVVLVILSLGLLGVIIYFLISPKSSRILRISAIIALGLIGLSLAVCGIFLIKGPSQGDTVLPLPFLPEDTPQNAKKTDLPVILTFLVAFLFIVVLVVRTSMKEKNLKIKPANKAPDVDVFQASDDLNLDQTPLDDDSFDIGLD